MRRSLLSIANVIWLVAAVLIGASVLTVLHFLATHDKTSSSLVSPDKESQIMQECETRTEAKLESVRTDFYTTKVQDVAVLESVTRYCFSDAARQAMLTDYDINRSLFKEQLSESRILLVLVVVITASGVVLAAVQLVASYKLASAASLKELGNLGGTLTVEAGKISLGSSVTGLIILAMSFAFFIVFVKEVYTLTDRFLDPATAEAASSENGVFAASDTSPSSAPVPSGLVANTRVPVGIIGAQPSALGSRRTQTLTGFPVGTVALPPNAQTCTQQRLARNTQHRPATDKSKVCREQLNQAASK